MFRFACRTKITSNNIVLARRKSVPDTLQEMHRELRQNKVLPKG